MRPLTAGDGREGCPKLKQFPKSNFLFVARPQHCVQQSCILSMCSINLHQKHNKQTLESKYSKGEA